MTEPTQWPEPREGSRHLVFAADHAGWRLKDHLLACARDAGFETTDLGTSGDDRVDYPDFAADAARTVVGGRADLAVVVCGTGIGVAISANKVRGARAAVVHDAYTAYYARNHNDANVLCVGARVVGEGVAESLVATWLGAEFGGGRHADRVAKMNALDEPDAGAADSEQGADSGQERGQQS